MKQALRHKSAEQWNLQHVPATHSAQCAVKQASQHAEESQLCCQIKIIIYANDQHEVTHQHTAEHCIPQAAVCVCRCQWMKFNITNFVLLFHFLDPVTFKSLVDSLVILRTSIAHIQQLYSAYIRTWALLHNKQIMSRPITAQPYKGINTFLLAELLLRWL